MYSIRFLEIHDYEYIEITQLKASNWRSEGSIKTRIIVNSQPSIESFVNHNKFGKHIFNILVQQSMMRKITKEDFIQRLTALTPKF